MEGDNDDKYLWGLFYFNLQDQRLIVPKRFGIGSSFNFGHPGSWLALAIIALCVIIALSV
jgi:uncharacterized membrane protein